MRDSHPSLDRDIPADSVLWRYLDFQKYVSMLKEEALWFSRSDLLGDPLEGSFTQAREVERQKAVENPPVGRTREEIEEIIRRNVQVTSEFRLMVYVNCWHRGDHESMALWRGYGGGPYAVAVRTTFGLLDKLLPLKFRGSGVVPLGAAAQPHDKPPDAMQIYLTKVQYVNHDSATERFADENNLFTPFAFKSVSYKNESEIRGLYWNMPAYDSSIGGYTNPSGLLVPVDLNALITGVVVSPLAPEWFTPVVRSVNEKFGLRIDPTPSLTSRPPVY